jgi:hypothetical protein
MLSLKKHKALVKPVTTVGLTGHTQPAYWLLNSNCHPLLTSLHRRNAPMILIGAEDFAWKPFWNQNMPTEKPQHSCTDAFFCTVGLASTVSFLHLIAMSFAHCNDTSILIASVQPVVLSSFSLDHCFNRQCTNRYI